MAKWTISQTVDLLSGRSEVEYRAGVLFYVGDKNAHLWRVRVTEGGKPAQLTGTVTGSFVRADGTMVPLTGTIQGDTAEITLTSGCSVVAGDLMCLMELETGESIIPLAAMILPVRQGKSDRVADPEHIIPSIQEIRAAVAGCKRAEEKAIEATGAANTAAGEANAAAGRADEAAGAANQAAGAANEAAGAASAAAGRADEAAGAANKAAGEANAAAGRADEAAGAANKAAGEANAAAGEARQAVTDIAAAKTDAEQAVQDAQTAVETAEAWSGATATAETISHGQTPTVSVVDGPGGKELHFQVPEGRQGPKGDTGNGFPEGGANGQILQKDDSVPGGGRWVENDAKKLGGIKPDGYVRKNEVSRTSPILNHPDISMASLTMHAFGNVATMTGSIHVDKTIPKPPNDQVENTLMTMPDGMGPYTTIEFYAFDVFTSKKYLMVMYPSGRVVNWNPELSPGYIIFNLGWIMGSSR